MRKLAHTLVSFQGGTSRISKSLDVDLTAGLRKQGLLETEEIKVGALMRLKLKGDGFAIEALCDEDQPVFRERFAHWEWDVLPLRAGTRKLRLVVAVRIEVPRYLDEAIYYPVLEKEVRVHVNIRYTLAKIIIDKWQWIIGALGGFGVILVWFRGTWQSLIKKRRRAGY